MERARGELSHLLGSEEDVRSNGGGHVLGAVKVETHEPPGRLTKIENLRDRLLATIAALRRVNGGAQKVELMRDRFFIDLPHEARAMIHDAQRLRCPQTSEELGCSQRGVRLAKLGVAHERQPPRLGKLRIGTVGHTADSDLRPVLDPHGSGGGRLAADVLNRRARSEYVEVVAVNEVDAVGERHELEVRAKTLARARIGDEEE